MDPNNMTKYTSPFYDSTLRTGAINLLSKACSHSSLSFLSFKSEQLTPTNVMNIVIS